MINTIQTREDVNQVNWISDLQEEAIKETNNTKEIVKDFEETENRIKQLNMNQSRRASLEWKEKNKTKSTKSNNEMIRTDVNEKDSRLSKEAWDKIDEFKINVKKNKIENKGNRLFLENIYNWLSINLIEHWWETLVVFVDKNSKNNMPPRNFPVTEEQVLWEDKKLFKYIVWYAGSFWWNFTSKNFEAKSHYGQAFHKEYEWKWFASLARNIKEYIDGRLKNDYSWKLSNTLFLIKRWYYPKNYITEDWDILEMSIDKKEKLLKALQEKRNEDLPFTIQLEYDKNLAEKYQKHIR